MSEIQRKLNYSSTLRAGLATYGGSYGWKSNSDASQDKPAARGLVDLLSRFGDSHGFSTTEPWLSPNGTYFRRPPPSLWEGRMSQHPGRGLFLSVLCIPTALQPSPRLGSTLPKGGWHNDSPSKVSAIRLTPKRLIPE